MSRYAKAIASQSGAPAAAPSKYAPAAAPSKYAPAAAPSKYAPAAAPSKYEAYINPKKGSQSRYADAILRKITEAEKRQMEEQQLAEHRRLAELAEEFAQAHPQIQAMEYESVAIIQSALLARVNEPIPEYVPVAPPVAAVVLQPLESRFDLQYLVQEQKKRLKAPGQVAQAEHKKFATQVAALGALILGQPIYHDDDDDDDSGHYIAQQIGPEKYEAEEYVPERGQGAAVNLQSMMAAMPVYSKAQINVAEGTDHDWDDNQPQPFQFISVPSSTSKFQQSRSQKGRGRYGLP